MTWTGHDENGGLEAVRHGASVESTGYGRLGVLVALLVALGKLQSRDGTGNG